MAKEENVIVNKCKCFGGGGSSGAIYGMGFLGALFYFLPSAPNFQALLIGIFISIFWPALFVYKALGMLNF